LNDYTSEQELLFLLTNNKNVKFFEFNDWDDLQRGVLKVLDIYDESKYNTHINYLDTEIDNYIMTNSIVVSQKDYVNFDDSKINYPLSNQEIIKKIMTIPESYLNKMDLSNNNYMLDNMRDFALYYHYPSGREHYRLLTYISKLYNNEVLYDIGTNNGCSAIALSDNQSNSVKSYDIVDYKHPGVINKSNIVFFLEDISKNIEVLMDTRFIMLDANHDGFFEKIFYKKLKEINYKGILFLDDIHLNSTMKEFWGIITEKKYDITIKGHNTGSGLVLFE
jgi:hypothetical protein